jgi:RNA polymerase sigma-70 factor (ECF subfamily)
VETPTDKHAATEDLVPLVYQELREVARRYFRNQRPGFTLRPTELVNEACLHLLQHASGPWEGPEHFRAIATRKIWQVIIDHLKRRHADKRGGGRPRQRAAADSASAAPEAQAEAEAPGAPAADKRWQRVPLESIRIEWHDRQVELLDLADALHDLAEQHARLSEVVMLHWFGGLKYADVARLLGVSASTVEKDFRYALAWLNRRLDRGGDDG